MKKINCFKIITNGTCNKKCKYCFEQNNKIKINIITDDIIEKFFVFFEENASEKSSIQLMGGETFLYPDIIKKFFKKINKKNNLSIFTNGTIFNEKIKEMYSEMLKENKNFFICITDHNLELFEDNNMYMHLDFLIKNNIEFEYKILLSKQSNDIDKVILHAKKVIKLLKKEISICIESYNDKFNFSKKEIVYILNKINENKEDKMLFNSFRNSFPVLCVGNTYENKDEAKNFCGAGVKEITIMSNGDIIPCENIMFKENLYEKLNVKNIDKKLIEYNTYKKLNENYMKITNEDGYKCIECPLINFCMQCACNYSLGKNENQLFVKNNKICKYWKMIIEEQIKILKSNSENNFKKEFDKNINLFNMILGGLQDGLS